MNTNLEFPFSNKERRKTSEVFEVSSFFIPQNKNLREVCISCNLSLPKEFNPNSDNIVCLGLAKSPKERYDILLNTKNKLEFFGYTVDFKTLKNSHNTICPYEKSEFYEKYRESINPLLKNNSPLYANYDEKTGILFSAFPDITISSISNSKNIYFILYRKERWLLFWNGEREAISEVDLKKFLVEKAKKLKIDQEIINKIEQI